MVRIIADSGRFITSLDLQANYDAPFGDSNVTVNRFSFAFRDQIFYSGKRFGPQDPGPVTASADIDAYGYRVPEGPTTERASAPQFFMETRAT